MRTEVWRGTYQLALRTPGIDGNMGYGLALANLHLITIGAAPWLSHQRLDQRQATCVVSTSQDAAVSSYRNVDSRCNFPKP